MRFALDVADDSAAELDTATEEVALDAVALDAVVSAELDRAVLEATSEATELDDVLADLQPTKAVAATIAAMRAIFFIVNSWGRF